jgi:purine-binding chemotaxis protein CheW
MSACSPVSASEPGVRRAAPGRYLTFTAGGDIFGLPVTRVREIIRKLDRLTHIPQMPAYISGCLNLRGTVVPVMDLRAKFGVAAKGEAALNCIVIAEVAVGAEGVLPTGLIVDTVEEVIQFKPADLEPAPEFGGGLDTRFVQGMAKLKDRLVALLNLDQVLAQHTLLRLKEGVEAVAPEEAAAIA